MRTMNNNEVQFRKMDASNQSSMYIYMWKGSLSWKEMWQYCEMV